jgi:hypothetical protein
MEQTWDTAWASALDELEMTVEQAELLLHSAEPEPEPLPPWQPPALTGPPPPNQLERAHLLLERHLRVTHAVAEAMAATRQQLALTNKMNRNRPQETPVYLDVTA